ncbi:hypothetical protein FRX31_005643 [Thalictrum thalictroides]|uniref:Uncharacterized protein n=1 Tax=Thalictrum thalictroides TaxID=46969 RepID=A0A7J6X4U3_THATH|nr:hypothetical protein FRX31_005643 [Thalictrum thalictroides]
MEGLIPLVYRAIVHYRTGEQSTMTGSSWFNESPSASYMRLPGDSGRFKSSEMHFFRPDSSVFSSSTSSSSNKPISSTSQLLVTATTQSPLHRTSTSRRLVS